MKVVMVILFFGVSCFAYSQTKIIAHKSHSGAKKHFSTLYKQNKTKDGNFGDPGYASITVLDTVHAINDSVTVVKYRESRVCVSFGTNYKDLSDEDFKYKTDTVVSKTLIYKSFTASFIKKEQLFVNLINFYFLNPISEVVFIGFREE